MPPGRPFSIAEAVRAEGYCAAPNEVVAIWNTWMLDRHERYVGLRRRVRWFAILIGLPAALTAARSARVARDIGATLPYKCSGL